MFSGIGVEYNIGGKCLILNRYLKETLHNAHKLISREVDIKV